MGRDSRNLEETEIEEDRRQKIEETIDRRNRDRNRDRRNNKNRSIDNIGEEQNLLEEQKNREDSGRRKKLREGRGRYVSERRKIQEKEAEGITHSKGAEKTDQKRYS